MLLPPVALSKLISSHIRFQTVEASASSIEQQSTALTGLDRRTVGSHTARVEVRWHNSVVPSQNYANHAHRPTMTVLAGACLLVAIVGFVMQWRRVGGLSASGIGLGGLTAAVAALVSMSRQYTTRLQDRIIRLEMRVRCASFLAPEQQRALQALDLRRIAALRFASDEEIPSLLDRAVRDALSPDQIKRSVKNWVPDLDRT
jgi:hypothetical protein